MLTNLGKADLGALLSDKSILKAAGNSFCGIRNGYADCNHHCRVCCVVHDKNIGTF